MGLREKLWEMKSLEMLRRWSHSSLLELVTRLLQMMSIELQDLMSALLDFELALVSMLSIPLFVTFGIIMLILYVGSV